MAKRDKPKPAAADNTDAPASESTNADANGSAEVVDPEAEAKKAARREAREKEAEGRNNVARAFKALAARVTAHLTAGNSLFGEKDGGETDRDAVFEIINKGDEALAVGFASLDKPKAARGASVNDLKEQRSQATRRFINKEITEDEWAGLTYSIESKIRRLEAAEKKRTEAERQKAETAAASA